MNNENKSLIPINTGLGIQQKRNIKRIGDGAKRIGKVLLSSGGAVVSLGASAIIGGPIAASVGIGACTLLMTNAFQEMIYKRTKDSMFVTRRNINGEILLFQDAWNIKSFNKIKGFESHEKGATMGLEMLVGLERYKQQFADQNKNIQDGIYPTVFSTKTHGINIKTIEALENLGYLKIESKEPQNKSILLAEKIGFKQYKEAKEAVIAKIKSDNEKLNEHQKQMYNIKFKLTDKPVDIEEIYKNYLQLKQTRERTPNRKDIMRIGVILQALENRNIDLERDNLGILKIKYNSNESFAKRIENENQKEESSKKFRESLRTENEVENIKQNSQIELTQQIEQAEER